MPRRRPCLAPPPAPLGLRFRALLGLGFVPPPEPRPCAHCASIAYALLPAARVPLCRHRADPESSSRPLPSGSPARIAPTACRHPHPSMSPPSRSRAHRPPIAPTACRHPRHPPHLSPRVAAAPGPWPARIAPHASLFRQMREKGPLPGNIRSKCMLFEIKMATSSPHASISGCNRAIQDTWRANLAAKGPFSRRGARNHAWREDVASAARPFRGSGMRSGGTGLAPCGSGMRHAAWPNGLCALRRGPGLLAACAPPVISLVSAAACAPCHLARVHRRRLIRVALRRPHRVHRAQPSAAPPIAVGVSRLSVSSCCPRAAHADASRPPMRARRRRPIPTPSRPPMRARRHRLGPDPREPSPSPEPTEPHPPVEPPAPTRAPPPAASHPAAWVPLRFW